MRKKTIYIFGNPLLPFDSLPIKLVPKLRKKFPEINFVVADPNENLKPEDGVLWIIDTIVGIRELCDCHSRTGRESRRLNSRYLDPRLRGDDKKREIRRIQVIDDLDKVQLNKIYSAHDFDLGFNLKLLAKIGELKKVTILGVPVGMEEEEALEQLSKKIFNLKFKI